MGADNKPAATLFSLHNVSSLHPIDVKRAHLCAIIPPHRNHTTANYSPYDCAGPGTLPGLNPPVIEAIRAGGEQIILALLRVEPEAAVKARDVECGATALHWAAVGGDIEIVHTLIQHGADVNVCYTAPKNRPLLA